MRHSPVLVLLAALSLAPATWAEGPAWCPAPATLPASHGEESSSPALRARILPPQPEVIRGNSEWRERDNWQRPHDLMDELGLGPGSMVADVGAGRGYFSFHLAERVGPQGRVYAVDISERELQSLRRAAERHRYAQIRPLLSRPADPKLPAAELDAVLVINAYHEFREFDAMLAGLHASLKPGGLLAVVDRDAAEGEPRDAYHQRHAIPESLVVADAERHGFRLLRRPPGFTTDLGREWYFLVFEKAEPSPCRLASAPVPAGRLTASGGKR
jgi:predicted methyltransferase